MKIQQPQWGIALLRIVTGIIFFVHGWQKLFTFGYEGTTGAFTGMGVPLPEIAAALAIAVELLGGLALILGFMTRLVAVPLAIDMLAALFMVHLSSGFFAANGGYEFVLLLAAASLALVLTGGGAFALDNLGAVRRVMPRRLRA
ncbi:MAG: DoxX family protein [Herpetosiphonaceae bacterium]|nr:DoxX family protein [Herpetosiphonaceae bacterium]